MQCAQTMKTIDWTNRFKRDYRREAKNMGQQALKNLLADVMFRLILGDKLQPRHKDHALTGDWQGCRDCHLKPDLIMIYEVNDKVLILHRLGSHSELFG